MVRGRRALRTGFSDAISRIEVEEVEVLEKNFEQIPHQVISQRLTAKWTAAILEPSPGVDSKSPSFRPPGMRRLMCRPEGGGLAVELTGGELQLSRIYLQRLALLGHPTTSPLHVYCQFTGARGHGNAPKLRSDSERLLSVRGGLQRHVVDKHRCWSSWVGAQPAPRVRIAISAGQRAAITCRSAAASKLRSDARGGMRRSTPTHPRTP